MRRCKVTSAILALASSVAAQNAASNQVLLTRIRAHMRDEFSRLPNYTCLEFTEIDGGGPPLRFYADLRSIEGAPGIQPSLWREFQVETGPNSGSEEKITMPELPGVASFFIRGGRLSAPDSLRMTWVTRSLTR